MATKEQIAKLHTSLLNAKEQASIFKDANDEGTCNFDTPQLFLKGWRSSDIEQAFKNTGLSFFRTGYVIDVLGIASGQASRRTKMAEVACKSLKADGYES